MPTLTSHVNTENTALVIIKRKGYQYWYDEKAEMYFAEKNGWDFAAPGATELLGVIAIFEQANPTKFKEYWWRIDKPWLKSSVPSEPQPYRPVYKRPSGSE